MSNGSTFISPSLSCTDIVVERDAWIHGIIRTPLRLEEGLEFHDAGTNADPTLRFAGAPGTGILLNAEGDGLDFVVNAVPVLQVTGTGARFGGTLSAGTGDTTLGSPTNAISMSSKVLKNVSDVLGPNGVSLLGDATSNSTSFTIGGSGTGTVTLGTFTSTTERAMVFTITALCGDATADGPSAIHATRVNARWPGGLKRVYSQSDVDEGMEGTGITATLVNRTLTIRGTSTGPVHWQGRVTFVQLFV